MDRARDVDVDLGFGGIELKPNGGNGIGLRHRQGNMSLGQGVTASEDKNAEFGPPKSLQQADVADATLFVLVIPQLNAKVVQTKNFCSAAGRLHQLVIGRS